MRYRILTAVMCSLAILASYVPSAMAESPPHGDTIGDLAPAPVGPQPPVNPCAPLNCQDIPVVIVACLDWVNGCDDPGGHSDPGFELCLNPQNEPCDPPEDTIDDLLDPSTVPDPGGDGPGPGPGPGDGDGGAPQDPGPGAPEPTPEDQTPTEPQPESEPDPEPDGPAADPGAGPGGAANDIDAPRPGNPNFTG